MGFPPIAKERILFMKDNEIIALYWERKEMALSVTEEKYGKYCHSISYRILHNHEDARECVNDTYLRAWDSMPPKKPDCLSVYLGKITRNLSLNRLKLYQAKKRGLGETELVLSELEECIPAQTKVEQVVEELVLVNVINEFLRKQKKEKRSIFVRRYWYVFSIKEITREYHMSESKVVSILFRMRQELKEQLEKEGITL